MGTNFYLTERAPCRCCERPYPEHHIGKRSAGWKFGLRGRWRGDSWAALKDLIRSGHSVRDEYGQAYSADEMIRIVEEWQTGLSYAEECPGPESFTDPEGYVLTLGEFS